MDFRKNFHCFMGLALGGLFLAGCGSNKDTAAEQEGMPPVPVTISPVVMQDIHAYIDALGSCTAFASVDINPQVTGELKKICFKEGDRVQKGDLLFVIDERPYKAELQRQEASLSADEAKLKLNEAKLKRSSTLVKGNFISQQDLETDEANVEMTRAAIAADKAAIEKAKINLDYCFIHSPIDGIAGKKQLDAGNIITTTAGNSPLVTIRTVETLYADCALAESDFLSMKSVFGKSPVVAEITLLADPQVKTEAKLIFRDNQVASTTGMVALRAELANKDWTFWPGQAIRVRLLWKKIPGATLVPSAAIQSNQQGSFLYVLKEDQTVDMRPAALGQAYGDLIHVAQGVKSGDKVVTSQQLMLHPGAKIVVVAPDGPGGSMPSVAAK